MALDPTKVTGKSTALLTKRTEAFEDAAADLNLAVLRIDETSPDPDTAKHRVKVAKAVLSGDETSVRQAVFGDLSDDDRHVIEEVFSGRLTKANLDQLRQQSAQAAQPAAQQPQVVQGNVVTPSQEVIDTVNETATLASNGATAAKEAKEELAKLKEELDNLSAIANLGAKKQILKIYNSAVAKVAAAESAANNTKNKAEEAKTKASQAGSGNAAPATQAIPAAPNP